MKFLLTNDDGIHAPGLKTLEDAMRDLGEIVTVAPDRHLSGCSHQVNADRPLQVSPVGDGRFAVDGTPADCTRLGLHHLAEGSDWVLSGINDGGNLGVDVFMSGTVAGVREAAWHHVRGIAFSQYRKSRLEFDWPMVVPLVRRIVRELWEQPLNADEFWNVNLPDLQADGAPPADPEKVEIVYCPLNPHPLPTKFDVADRQYTYRGVYADRHRDEGTDVDVCFKGQVAVTKILPHYTA